MLWDVDGTLIGFSGIVPDLFARACEHAVGRRPSEELPMAGATDLQIARSILDFMGEPHDHVPAVIARLEHELATAVAEFSARAGILPGVCDVLPSLHDDPGVLQSVLTGNTVTNTATKLRALQLDRWIDPDVGAYGSDHHDRTALVPVALGRAEERYGRRFEPHEVWVVGDTEHDLACARAAGARCLLVGTGLTPVDKSTAARADAYLPDLSDVDAVVALLRS